MDKNEQKTNASPDNNTNVPVTTPPVVENKQPAPVVEASGSDRASPSPAPTTPNWAKPVADELKAPNTQSASTPKPTQGTPAPSGTDTKVEDPVADRNGRAPNPPTTPTV